MKLHNTLTRKLENFQPLGGQQVTLYTCGPTVYDYMHIGNLRKFIFDDSWRRTLIASGYNVKHVMNITDVGHLVSDSDEGEDKLEKGAKREGKSVWEVAKYYTEAFKKDVLSMNILPPNGYHGKTDNYARATDFVNQQIDMVKILLDKDFAYRTKEAIYFDVSKLASYGELTGQKLSDKEIAVRREVIKDKNKRSPQDFGLWFFTIGRFVNHDMRWPSPWGEGFPGWHLECSAIIHSILGDPIDIHTGGVDNIGTHHVNEMAQTEAAYGHKLAKYWLHSEHLLVDGQRMSKSSGNYYTLKDVVAKGYNPLALRLLYLQAHYRSPINFTWKSLEAAQNRLKGLYAFADLKHQDNFQTWLVNEKDQTYEAMINGQLGELRKDLDTPSALGFLSQNISHIELNGYNKKYFQKLLNALDDFYGLNLSDRPDITEKQKSLMAGRETARRQEKWDEADALRQQLSAGGLAIVDSPRGPIWRQA